MIQQYAHILKNVLLSNFQRLPFPYKLTFAVTYRCIARCKTCNIWKKKNNNELSIDEIEQFFKRSNKFSWIDLTGGEPFLRNDFVSICEIILRYCNKMILLHFPTNGYLTEKIIHDTKMIRKLGSSFKIIVTVSIDGDEHLNNAIRGLKDGWQRQIETFRQLREIKQVEAVVGMTLSQYNFDKFETTYNSVKKIFPWLKPGDFHINLENYSEHYYDNKNTGSNGADEINRDEINRAILQSVIQYKKMMGFPKSCRSLLEYIFLKGSYHYLQTGKTPLPCHALSSSCFIDPSGEVYPCIIFSQSLGNLRDCNYELNKIWNTELASSLQKEIWKLKCPQCWTGCDAYQTIMGNVKYLYRTIGF